MCRYNCASTKWELIVDKAQQPSDRRGWANVRIPISWKLLGASVVVGTIATGIAIHGLRRMHAMNERLTSLVDYSSAKVTLAALLKQDLTTITRAEKNLILAITDDEIQRNGTSIDDTLAAMKQHQERLAGLVDETDRSQLNTFARDWLKWQRIHRDVRHFAQLKSNVRARDLALGRSREAYEKLESALTALATTTSQQSQRKVADADAQQLAAIVDRMNRISLVAVGVAKIQRIEKQMILADDELELHQYEESFAPIESQVNVQLDQLRQQLAENEQQELTAIKSAFQSYIELLKEMRVILAEKGKFSIYQFVFNMGAPLAANCERLLNEIISHNEADLQTSHKESRENYVSSRNTLLGFSTVGIVVSVMVTYFTGQRIALNLARLADYARFVEDSGDLSKPVPRVSRDEVGLLAESFERLRASLYRQTSELAALNRALEHKNREMEQFVYTVSHDLSSPLVSCKGLVGLMRQDIAAGKMDDVIASAKRLDGAVDQLRHIIDDLLKLSRIGRKPLQLTLVDVEALIRGLEEELASRLQSVRAEMRIETPLPRVVADEPDLKRVFDNLLTNALKYACDKENSVITVGGMKLDNEVRYFVHDNGPGIDPKFQTKIFGLFQRLDSDKPGTGVGLASVDKIVRMHGGRCWVESALGQGATFWIALPEIPATLTAISSHPPPIKNFVK